MPIGFFADADGVKYHKAYFATFAGKWHHGDFIARTKQEGYIIYGRSDTVLNPGGVRIGTAEIYRVVETLPEISEALAVGQNFDNDVRVILFVVLKPDMRLYDARLDDALQTTIKTAIKNRCTPRHVPAKIIAVSDIPRTRSGKITEATVRDIINGKPPNNIGALANPQILQEYQQAYQQFLRD